MTKLLILAGSLAIGLLFTGTASAYHYCRWHVCSWGYAPVRIHNTAYYYHPNVNRYCRYVRVSPDRVVRECWRN